MATTRLYSAERKPLIQLMGRFGRTGKPLSGSRQQKANLLLSYRAEVTVTCSWAQSLL